MLTKVISKDVTPPQDSTGIQNAKSRKKTLVFKDSVAYSGCRNLQASSQRPKCLSDHMLAIRRRFQQLGNSFNFLRVLYRFFCLVLVIPLPLL